MYPLLGTYMEGKHNSQWKRQYVAETIEAYAYVRYFVFTNLCGKHCLGQTMGLIDHIKTVPG